MDSHHFAKWRSTRPKSIGKRNSFMHSGNHQESDLSDFAEAVFALFSYVSDTFFFGGFRMQKYYEIQYF